MKSTANEARKGEGIVMNNSKRDSSYNSLSLSLSGWLAGRYRNRISSLGLDVSWLEEKRRICIRGMPVLIFGKNG